MKFVIQYFRTEDQDNQAYGVFPTKHSRMKVPKILN